jgi:hypothetical protein
MALSAAERLETILPVRGEIYGRQRRSAAFNDTGAFSLVGARKGYSDSHAQDKDYLIYERLDPDSQEIRLLKIHPGASADGIETSLVTALLVEAQSYEAISYVWESYKERASMVVDGQSV